MNPYSELVLKALKDAGPRGLNQIEVIAICQISRHQKSIVFSELRKENKIFYDWNSGKWKAIEFREKYHRLQNLDWAAG